MRTNIDIDDKLMRKAMAASGTSTKKAAVEEGLRLLVQLKEQSRILDLRGKIVWRGPDDDWFASDEEILKKRYGADARLPQTDAEQPEAESIEAQQR